MPKVTQAPTEAINAIARPWDKPTDVNALLGRIGEAHYVLLGEASHGTHEYYTWRAQISKRLILEKGFSFIAVEGDWPDCYQLNRYIKHYPRSAPSAVAALQDYRRWPTWMWANTDIANLAEWLHAYNERRHVKKRIGFYGLDVYSLWDSIRAVVAYLERVDPDAAEQAREAYRCFEPYADDATSYAYGTAFTPTTCEAAVIKVLEELRQKVQNYPDDTEAAFDAEQNARVVVNAERYYRTMVRGDQSSWNVRDHHMVETLNHLMKRYGENAKAIVWAHNTHVGDARYTSMLDAGLVNIGQLVREEQTPADTILVGFGSYTGSVVAGRYWDAPVETLRVPPAKEGSWEALLHEASPQNKLILSAEAEADEPFWQLKGHRAIGVVYDPEHERGNYVPTLLPERYDAFIYLDKTSALQPLHVSAPISEDLPETYPWTT
jgi:erythromycin esterase